MKSLNLSQLKNRQKSVTLLGGSDIACRPGTYLLDNEAIELEFISVLIYYTYKRKQKREESMMCRNDKSRVGPKWKTQHLPPVPEQHEGKQNIK